MSKETDKQLQFQALSRAVSNNDDATIRNILADDRSILDLDRSDFSLPMIAVDYPVCKFNGSIFMQ